jgi:serine/threonine protein kinase
MFQFSVDVQNKLNQYMNNYKDTETSGNQLSNKTFYRPHATVLSKSILNKTYHLNQPVKLNVKTPLSRRKCSDSYELVQILGEGQYGMVTKARRKSDGKQVAIKKIKMAWAEKYNEGFPITTIREIGILISERVLPIDQRHLNVVGLLDVVLADTKYDQQDSNDWKDAICLVFEYLDYDFGALIANPTTIMTMDHVRCYMKQILNALIFAEERQLMHRDLKPANLLLSKSSNTIKFADWGMARKELNETKAETLITVRVIDGCFWMTRGPWHRHSPVAVPRLALRLLRPATYDFDQSHPSNAGYPLCFTEMKYKNRITGGRSEEDKNRPKYDAGEIISSNLPLGTPGAGFKFCTTVDTPSYLNYFCPNQNNMGGPMSIRNPYTVEVVSLCWRAPELLLQEKIQKARKKGLYDTKLDLWAAGCIMAEMLRNGKPILPGRSELDQLIKILKLCGTPEASYWEKLLQTNFSSESVLMLKRIEQCERSIRGAFSDFPEDMVDLLDKILVIDPKKRITLQEARDHRFFKGAYNINANLCPNCNEYHNELDSFNMRSTHENDLSKRKEEEMEQRRRAYEERRMHNQLLKEEEDRLQKIEDEKRAIKKLKDAEIVVVNSKTMLTTIKTSKIQAFKVGIGKGSLVLKGRRVNPFKR